jgi:hypothetical protein
MTAPSSMSESTSVRHLTVIMPVRAFLARVSFSTTILNTVSVKPLRESFVVFWISRAIAGQTQSVSV